MFNPPNNHAWMSGWVNESARACVCLCLFVCMHAYVCVCMCWECVYMTVVSVTVKLSGLPPHAEDGHYTNPLYHYHYYYFRVWVYVTVVNVTVKLSGLPPHVEDGCYTNPLYYHDYYFMACVRRVSLLPVAEGRCCSSACAWQEPPGRACTRGCWEHPSPAPHSPLPSSPAPSTICSKV